MLSIIFGLVSAASWGAGDFCGGLAARRANVYSVVIVSQIVGGLALTLVALVAREALPPLASLAWGAGAGVSGAAGLLALYRGLASGRMGVVAPLSAVFAAAVPVLAAAVTEGLPRPVTLLGFALALAAVWLLSRPEAAAFQARDLALPLAAGLGFGLFFVLIHRASETAVFWPLVAARLASMLCLFIAARVAGQSPRPASGAVGLMALGGLLDTGGNAFFALAAQAGRLDVAAVLASLYPASTVVLAGLVLKEKFTRGQLAGVLTALAAIALIAS